MQTYPHNTPEANTPNGANGRTPPAPAAFDFWRTAYAAVRGRSRLVLLVTAAGAVAGSGLGLMAGQRLYTATGLVRLASALPAVLKETDQNRPMAMFDGFIQAQAQVMSGREVVDAAMNQDAWKKLRSSSRASTPEQFASCLKVETRPRSDFLQVKFTHKDPQVAAAAVQSIISAYKDVFTHDQDHAEGSRMEFLQQRRAALQTQAADLQARIDKTSNGRTLTEIDPMCAEVSERVRKLRSALTDIQIAIEGGPGMFPRQWDAPVQSSSEGGGSDLSQHCASRIFKLECELMEARAAGMSDEHPIVIRLHNTIKAYRDQMASLPTEPSTAPDPALASASRRPLQEREAGLRALVQAAQDELNKLAAEREQLKHLDAESAALHQQLADTEMRLDALTTEASTGGRLAIVSAGDRPMTAVLDNRMKMAAAGAFAGALVPFAGLMATTILRRRYRTGEELAEDLGHSVPFVTVLPRIDGPGEAGGLAARCIHAARSRLGQLGVKGPRVYIVSSAGVGDGKSGVALSLSLSLASSGLRTLLIDADLTTQHLTHAFKAGDAQGLFEAATTAQEPSLQHLRAGPWMLTTGRLGGADVTRITPSALRALLTKLRERFDAIIIDSDPLLTGSAAPVFAPHADGIILVVSAGSRATHVQHAARQAQLFGVPLACAVFNRADPAQFPKEMLAASPLTGLRTLPSNAATLGPLVGAVLESLSHTREDDLALARSGIDLAARTNTEEEEEMHEAQKRKQGRSAA